MVDDEVRAVFERAGCTGSPLVRSPGGDAEFGLRADEPVVPAPVVKCCTQRGRRRLLPERPPVRRRGRHQVPAGLGRRRRQRPATGAATARAISSTAHRTT
ncbi:hypothetical protein [Streptomyces misionensis]|uniref:hypothetical protein n=1 Tax=Streptomyces misionensis TaxID=67331 RepID=UPI003BB20AB8